MRHLVYLRPRQLEWQDIAEPVLQGPGEALVRPIAVASCDLDGAIVRGQAPFRGPFAFGHEFVAQVMSIGPNVQSVVPGQIVAVPFAISCGTCAYCRNNFTASCTTVFYVWGGDVWWRLGWSPCGCSTHSIRRCHACSRPR